MLINLGFSAVQNLPSVAIPTGCSFDLLQIIDLSGINSFYFTTNVVTVNYNLIIMNGGPGCNI